MIGLQDNGFVISGKGKLINGVLVGTGRQTRNKLV